MWQVAVALQGLVVISGELEAAYRSISMAKVPDLWARVSYPSLKPLPSYLEDLYARLAMLQVGCYAHPLCQWASASSLGGVDHLKSVACLINVEGWQRALEEVHALECAALGTPYDMQFCISSLVTVRSS